MKTQGQKLLDACRKRWMTYGDLLWLGVSTCPHKRMAEAAKHHLREGEQLVRRLNHRGLVVFRVLRKAP